MDLSRPNDKDRQKNMRETAEKLNMIVKRQNEPAFLASSAHKKQEGDHFLRYTPQSSVRPGEMERIIQISTHQVDPLEPPKHKHKKVPTTSNEPPPVILRSPPR